MQLHLHTMLMQLTINDATYEVECEPGWSHAWLTSGHSVPILWDFSHDPPQIAVSAETARRWGARPPLRMSPAAEEERFLLRRRESPIPDPTLRLIDNMLDRGEDFGGDASCVIARLHGEVERPRNNLALLARQRTMHLAFPRSTGRTGARCGLENPPFLARDLAVANAVDGLICPACLVVDPDQPEEPTGEPDR